MLLYDVGAKIKLISSTKVVKVVKSFHTK